MRGGVVVLYYLLRFHKKKKTHLHETRHDRRYKHIEMLNQDSDNQDERNYILRTDGDEQKSNL